MKYFLFCFYDNKLELFLPPWAAPNRAVAVRGIMSMLKDPSSDFSKYPNDYNVFMVGEYDSQTAAIISIAPDNMGLVSQYLES